MAVRWMLAVAVAVAFVSGSCSGSETDDSLDQFQSMIDVGLGCSDLFGIGDDMRSGEQSLTEPLSDMLNSVGCFSPESDRADLADPAPSSACELAFASQVGRAVQYQSLWTPFSNDGVRWLLGRAVGDDYSVVWICDIKVIGEFMTPDSMVVLSVFSMPAAGEAPHQQMPPAFEVWAVADSR